MSVRIEVPGVVRFATDSVTFRFDANSAELDLTELVAHEPARKVLLAMLGVGFEDLTSKLGETAEDPKEPEPSDFASAVKDAEQQIEAAMKNAEKFLASAQQQFSDAQASAATP